MFLLVELSLALDWALDRTQDHDPVSKIEAMGKLCCHGGHIRRVPTTCLIMFVSNMPGTLIPLEIVCSVSSYTVAIVHHFA